MEEKTEVAPGWALAEHQQLENSLSALNKSSIWRQIEKPEPFRSKKLHIVLSDIVNKTHTSQTNIRVCSDNTLDILPADSSLTEEKPLHSYYPDDQFTVSNTFTLLSIMNTIINISDTQVYRNKLKQQARHDAQLAYPSDCCWYLGLSLFVHLFSNSWNLIKPSQWTATPMIFISIPTSDLCRQKDPVHISLDWKEFQTAYAYHAPAKCHKIRNALLPFVFIGTAAALIGFTYKLILSTDDFIDEKCADTPSSFFNALCQTPPLRTSVPILLATLCYIVILIIIKQLSTVLMKMHADQLSWIHLKDAYFTPLQSLQDMLCMLPADSLYVHNDLEKNTTSDTVLTDQLRKACTDAREAKPPSSGWYAFFKPTQSAEKTPLLQITGS